MVPKQVLEDIRFRSDIVDVIDSYITLPKKSAMIKALCPFHKEKTPSFTVNRQRQIFHCFGCGAGGDVFKFVMMYEQADFMTAVRILAERAGVVLQFEKSSGPPDERNLLLSLHEEAAALYHRTLLKDPAAQEARAYLEKRTLTPDTVEAFMIGYAPNQFDFLVNWAKSRKHSLEKLELAGLLVKNTERPDRSPYFDRFRNRVMFPIRNEQGRIIGFSGRTLLQDKTVAKYVNSPETPIFRKSHILYALDRGRRDIVDKREAIVCEGQIDVIRCHQAGFTTAVAAQGTAFTEDHARILHRYADSVALVFDSDEAGQNAAVKAAAVFMQAGMAVRIASLPQGEDPDSLILKQGAAAFQKALDGAVPALDFQINLLLARDDIRTEAGLMRVVQAVLMTIGQTPDAVQRDRLVEQAASRLLVSAATLHAQLKPYLKQATPRKAEAAPAAPAAPRPRDELLLVEHLAANPALVGLIEQYLPLSLITDKLCRAFVDAAVRSAHAGGDLMQAIADHDDTEQSLASFAASLFSAPSRSGRDTSQQDAIRELILTLWRTELQRRRKEFEYRSVQAGKDDAVMSPEYKQLTEHIHRLRRWDTGEPILALYAEHPADPKTG